MKEVQSATWEGREAWLLSIPFAKGFFVAPVLNTTWSIYVAKDDYSILAVSFLPPVEYQKVQQSGVKYKILKYDKIKGVSVPSQIVALGINLMGVESGTFRITKIQPTVVGPSDAGFFESPESPSAGDSEPTIISPD